MLVVPAKSVLVQGIVKCNAKDYMMVNTVWNTSKPLIRMCSMGCLNEFCEDDKYKIVYYEHAMLQMKSRNGLTSVTPLGTFKDYGENGAGRLKL